MTETSEQPQQSKKRQWWLKWVAAILVLAMLVWEVGLPIAADRWAVANQGIPWPIPSQEREIRWPEWFWSRLGDDWNTIIIYCPKKADRFWLVGHMKNLEEIMLSGIELDDADLLHLYKLKKVWSIRIIHCPSVTLEGVKKLSEQLPDCQIKYHGPEGVLRFGPTVAPSSQPF